MRITVNFSPETHPEEALSVAEIMRRRNFTFPHIISRLNGAPVPRGERETTMVRDGDDLELFHLVAGG